MEAACVSETCIKMTWESGATTSTGCESTYMLLIVYHYEIVLRDGQRLGLSRRYTMLLPMAMRERL